MAPRKTKPETTAPKPRAPVAPRATRQVAEPAGNGNSNRLLREAAWSRMFGRVEAKNPFTR
jgi:hypothetical protein